MKLFIVNVQEWKYDFVSSVAVLAENKDKAIKYAVKFDDFFEDNIGEVEEVSIDDEGMVK